MASDFLDRGAELAPSGVRAFVAIKLAAPLLAALDALQGQLRADVPRHRMRWVGTEQLHLTLVFLGNVCASQVSALGEAFRGSCLGLPALGLALRGLGAFPQVRQPRVIWVGVGGEVDALGQLQSRIALATKPFGDHDEPREFHPHITLARVPAQNRAASKAMGAALTRRPVGELGAWQVTEVCLMRSHLEPGGARYEDLAVATLGGGNLIVSHA